MSEITVIIPAFNEEKMIDECLASLTQQTYQDFKALIIDDASTDQTAAKIKNWVSASKGRIELREYGKVGPGRARNLAAREVSSEFIAFMDADCIATANWLEELLQGFKNDSIGSVGGPHIAPPQSSDFQRSVESFFQLTAPGVDFYKTPTSEIIEVPHNPLCNVAYRRGLFHAVGGFREDLFPGEDVEIDFKVRDLGPKILYNPRALVYHHRPENLPQFKKVMHAYGRAQGKLIREYGIRRKIQWLGIFSLGILLAVSGGIIFTFAWMGAALVAALWMIFFFFRPQAPKKFSLYFNALHWFNGLIEGFVTKRSPAPGMKSAVVKLP